MTTRARQGGSPADAFHRGAILLELMLSLAIFVSAGLAILGALESCFDAGRVVREAQVAADLARSAMAHIEAGIESAESLAGPVPAWADPDAATAAFEDAPPEESGWELEIQSDRSQFAGLSLVTVHAFRRESPTSDRIRASYTLRQLVRLFDRADDSVGRQDDLEQDARRWAPRADESVEAPPHGSRNERGGQR